MSQITVVCRAPAVERDGTRYFQRLDAQLLSGLCRRGVDVVCVSTVIGPEHPVYKVFSGYDATVSDSRLTFVIMPAYSREHMSWMGKLWNWMVAAKRMWQPIQSSPFLVTFMPSPTGLLATVIGALLMRRRVVYFGGDWSSGLNRDPGSGGRVIRWLRGRLQKLAYAVSPVVLVRDSGTYGELSRRRSGVQLAAPLTTFSPADVFHREDTCAGGRVACISVGGLLPYKGVTDILHAVRRLHDVGLKVEWWHAGASYPDFRAEIEKMVERLDLTSYIRFLGYLGHQELLEAYRSADILVHAARTEGMPRVLAEGMSQGLPAVATRVGGIPDALQDGEDALLVPPEDQQALAQAIQRVIGEGPLRRKLIRRGTEWARAELARDPVQQILSALGMDHGAGQQTAP